MACEYQAASESSTYYTITDTSLSSDILQWFYYHQILIVYVHLQRRNIYAARNIYARAEYSLYMYKPLFLLHHYLLYTSGKIFRAEHLR